MMHPPRSPGQNVFVNGGRGSGHTSIDAIPPQALTEKNPGRAAESLGNCIDDKSLVGKTENKEVALMKKSGSSDGREPPRATANISDLRLPLTETNSMPSTGGFVPLQLTSPTQSINKSARSEPESLIMAAKTPTESQAPASGNRNEVKNSEQNSGTKPNKSPSASPTKDEQESKSTGSNNQVQSTNMPSKILQSQREESSTAYIPPTSTSSGAPYIDDSDSEDEEVSELLLQKRNQIRADIAAYQKSKELELTIYEKRLRDDQMRKKRRKTAMANGYPMTSGSPRSFYSLSTKQVIGYLPGYLPLTAAPNNNIPTKPSGLRKVVESKPAEGGTKPVIVEQGDTKPKETSKVSLGPTAPETKPEITIKSSTETQKKDKLGKESTSISPINISQKLQPPAPANTALNLSYSSLKGLEGNEKPVTPLPSSLKSTSSWTSSSGKDSRRSSVADSKKKDRRVVFQLEVQGDWFRVKPDGEEVPMEEAEKERLRAESAIMEEDDDESESDFLEFRVPSNQQSTNPIYAPDSAGEQNLGYQALEELEGVGPASASTKPGRGPEDPDWVSMKPAVEESKRTNMSSAKSTVSDDSLDDVFDLDEEVPLAYEHPRAQPEFSSGSLEDSVMSLGLPLAPPPPPPPGGSSMNLPGFGLGKTGNGSFADTMAYIQAYQQAGISRGSSTTGSYLSSSFPRNSFGGTTSSWHDPPSAPRPSSSHGASTTSAPISIGRRPSNNWDLVTAPTLETLSSSTSGTAPGQPTPSMSGSLPVGSGFRRRSVTKYDISDEDNKDNSASSSVTSKTDSNTVIQTDARPIITASTATEIPKPTPTVRPYSEKEQKASPYGTSAPISIPPRNAPAAPVKEPSDAPEQVKDNVPNEVPETKLKRNLSFRQLLSKKFWKQPRKH